MKFSISTFFRILLLGQNQTHTKKKVKPAIKNQCLNVRRIWNNKDYNDFGIERIFRLLISISLFLFPGLYIRSISGKFGLISRKLAVEFYVILKLILPIIYFKLNLTEYLSIAILASYMAVETLVYLAALIFLSNEFTKPISYRRSILTLFINYIEICLDFAVIYSYCNFAIPNFFKEKLTTGIQAIYFSFVTSTTVGFGDITVTNSFGQTLVIIQILLFLMFIGLFINFFTSRANELSYYTTKKKIKNKNGL